MIQGASLIKNIKRLHSRDDALSETIDADLIKAARSNITPGTSLTGAASSAQQGVEASPTAVLEGTDNRSDLVGNKPADAVNDHSEDQDNNGAELDERISTISEEEILSISRAKSSPFYELAQYIFLKVQDRPSMLPKVPSGLSGIHDEMFRLALRLLEEPGDVIHKKDAFVLVSGIINTISPTGRSLSLSSQIVTESEAICMAYESRNIGILLNDLLDALYPDEDDPTAMSMENLQGVVYSLLSKSTSPRQTKDDKERYTVLKIMCQLLLCLEHDIFAKPVSEHVFVSVWSQILNTMLHGGGLRVIS
ncbi:hypothetical protein BGZ83_001217 [Gryganskiella cystojenkinii]|nr:hypothetical protein BGZ83_001217 [Gryganskiella cystojenkinii]